MTPLDYERLRILFHRALECPSEERETFAKKMCAGDAELQAELLALLRSASQPTDSLDTPIARFEAGDYYPGFSPNEILLNRFRIVRFLGRGGMGEVYEAEDLEMGRVALKTIRPEIAGDPHILGRFRNEVQFARRATGTNVCRIHEIFSLPASANRSATVFLTMEFLNGVTLAERLSSSSGILPLEEAESIAQQICRGLQTIHDAEVIHRDLKSRNIMLAERKRGTEAVLMDFGLARESLASSAAAAAASGATIPGAVVGTPEYMAPEQFQGGALTPATDIYALGIVLYELLTGKLPFEGPTPLAAAVQRAKPLSKVSTIRPGLPPRWDNVIERCLCYNPTERFQTAVEVAEALTSRPSLKLSARQYITNHRRTSILASLALVILVVSLLWYRAHSALPGASVAAKRWYSEGLSALREGTYLKASNALQMAADLDKNFVLAHARLADAWNELDFSNKAKDEILEASSLESTGGLSTLERQYVEAVRHTIMRDFSAAINDYQHIFDALPTEAKADGYVDLGRAYEKAGNFVQAIANYSAAAKLDPQTPAAFVRLGVLESRRKHTPEASAAFAQAERLYKAASNLEGIAEVDFQRGNNANTQLRLDEARTDLSQSLQAAKAIPSPQLEIRALTRLSVTEYLSHNTDKSIQLANQAIALAQENGLDYWAIDGLVRLGNAHISSGNYEQAGSYFTRALSLAEHSQRPRLIALAKVSLASVRETQNKLTEALSLAQSAFDFYRGSGFKTESIEALTVVLRAQRDDSNNTAALESGKQLLALAQELKEPAATARAEESVGSVLLDMEQYPEALDHFQNALAASRELNSMVDYQLLHCADALWRLGDFAQATQYLASVSIASRAKRGIFVSVKKITAAMLLSQKRFAEARLLAQNALADKANAELTSFYLLMAEIEAASGSPRRARDWSQKALREAQNDSDRSATAAANLSLANAYLALGDVAQSLPLAQQAHDFFASSGQKESECLSLLTLAKLSKATKNSTNAKRFAQEGMDILSNFEHNWTPKHYKTYSSRPDVRDLAAQFARLVR